MKKNYLFTILTFLLVSLFSFAQTARVQVIHNSADAAAALVDVYLDGTLLIDDFAFRTASPFIDAPASTEIEVAIAPSNSTSVSDAIVTFNYTLTENTTYVLVAEGIVSPSGYSPATAFGIAVYDMGREAAASTGNTDVLVHHGATDAPTVDVRERTLGATVVNDISYGDFQGYLELPTADYILDVQTSDATTTVASYSAPLSTLSLDNQALVVVASGFLDPTQNSNGAAFGLWVALPSGGALVELPAAAAPTARVQVIHNSADAAAALVDVYLDGTLLIDDFAFRTASAFIDAPATADIEVAIAPSTSTSVNDAIATFNYNLAIGETYVLVAEGIVSASGYSPATPFDIAVYDMGREAAASTGNTDVLVHHGATDAPTVDVRERTLGATIVNDASYGDFAGYLELPTADYILDVQTADATTTVASYSAPLSTLNLDDEALVVVASGFLDPTQNSNGAAFGLWVALPSGGALVELPAAAAPTARVQVIHNSADAAAALVDVYLDGALLIDNFAFRTASAFIDAPATADIEVAIAPSTSTSVNDAIATFNYNLAIGETYVLVAEGIVSASGYSPATPFDIAVYDMGREAAASTGNTDVLVHHGATDAPTVDVRERTLGATIVNDASYGDFAGYLELPTADYILDVQTADATTTVASYSAPLSTLNLDDEALVVVASGFLDPTQNSNGAAFGLWVALPSGGALVELPAAAAPTARVQVIHNSADAAAALVDVYLDGALLIDNFAFRTASAFIDAPATADIEVAIAPSTSTSVNDAIATFNYNLAIGETYVLVAEGIVSPSGYSPATAFDIAVYDMGREAAASTGNTDVLVHHGATDAPTVDVNEVTGPLVLVDDISFSEYSDYIELPTADYTINVSTANGATVVEEYLAPLSTLGLDDLAITVVASGFLDPTQNSNGAAFGLWVALPSGGALVELPTTALSVDEFGLTDINIYPNPAENILNINFKDFLETEAVLYDISGRMVRNKTLSNVNSTMDVSQLQNGVYILELSNEKGKATKKISIR
jgi:uncharacterized membrane protein YciS (DUF1049 family)/uncharacterized protein (DUF2236 family)